MMRHLITLFPKKEGGFIVACTRERFPLTLGDVVKLIPPAPVDPVDSALALERLLKLAWPFLLAQSGTEGGLFLRGSLARRSRGEPFPDYDRRCVGTIRAACGKLLLGEWPDWPDALAKSRVADVDLVVPDVTTVEAGVKLYGAMIQAWGGLPGNVRLKTILVGQRLEPVMVLECLVDHLGPLQLAKVEVIGNDNTRCQAQERRRLLPNRSDSDFYLV